jgi:hypothetical protein
MDDKPQHYFQTESCSLLAESPLHVPGDLASA